MHFIILSFFRKKTFTTLQILLNSNEMHQIYSFENPMAKPNKYSKTSSSRSSSGQEQYSPERVRKTNGSYHWTKEEHEKYIRFLEKNQDKFVLEANRKRKNLFMKMAEEIESRTNEQCRTHHEKQKKRFKSITGIIINFKDKQSGFEDSLFSPDANHEMSKLQIPYKTDSRYTEGFMQITLPDCQEYDEDLRPPFLRLAEQWIDKPVQLMQVCTPKEKSPKQDFDIPFGEPELPFMHY